MKSIYISRLGKSFYGGADNLQRFLLNAFSKKLQLDSPVVKMDLDELMKKGYGYLLNFDIIIWDSTQLPETETLEEVPKWVWEKTHIYMHSPIIGAESVMAETCAGPAYADWYDMAQFRKIVNCGAKLYYGSYAHALISENLINEGNYLDISEFRSKNFNKSGRIDNSKRIPNSVLFATGYYSPQVGIHNLMRLIKMCELHQYEWYIIGRPFDNVTYGTSGIKWIDYYQDILTREDVHCIEFNDDLSEYYKMCTFHLVLSPNESYSFKALEALSYGCQNISYITNAILPWSKYARLAEVTPFDDLVEPIKNLLMNPVEDNSDFYNRAERCFEEYATTGARIVMTWISWMMTYIFEKSVDYISDKRYRDHDMFHYNRLPQS